MVSIKRDKEEKKMGKITSQIEEISVQPTAIAGRRERKREVKNQIQIPWKMRMRINVLRDSFMS
jgi:hypothetical protein